MVVPETLALPPNDDREARLLLDCARASVEPERALRIRALAASDLDWQKLLTLAERHGLRPLVYAHLNRICPERVPAANIEFLRDYFVRNSAFNLLLTGELLRLLNLLNEHGVEAVAFKGPAIAVKLYGHVALRQFCDLDILVRARDVWRASELIETRGFEPDVVIPREHRAALVHQDYVQVFHRDGGRTLVELHWSIARRSLGVRFDADAIWPRLERMVMQEQTVFVPSAEDLLLMLCVHGARHSWDKLEGIASLAELVRGKDDFDWDYVWRQAGEMHCRRMVTLGLMLTRDLFDVALPPDAAMLRLSRTLQTTAGIIARNFFADDVQSPTFARQAALHLRLTDYYTDRARYCARVVLTPTADDWAVVRLHGPLSLAYPLVRAFRIARKALNQHRAAGACQ
jgi:hypothetical protein